MSLINTLHRKQAELPRENLEKRVQAQREYLASRPTPPPAPVQTRPPVAPPTAVPVRPASPFPFTPPGMPRPPVLPTQGMPSVLGNLQGVKPTGPVSPMVPTPFDKAVQQTLVGKATSQKRNWWDTTKDSVMRGVGWADQGIVRGADWIANALPRLEGSITGEDPESGTFTGAMLKPITDTTQKWVDYYDKATGYYDKNVQQDVKGNKVAKFVFDNISGTAAMVPTAIESILSSGTSAVPKLAPHVKGLSHAIYSTAKKIASKPMFKASFVQSVGGAYDEAKADGATDAEALLASTLSSAFNAAVEVAGGIETLPGELKAVDLSSPQKALAWVTSALEEGEEGVVQRGLTNLTNFVVYGSQNRSTLQDLGSEFVGNAVPALIAGGGQVLANDAFNAITKPQKSAEAPKTPEAQFNAAVQDALNPKPVEPAKPVTPVTPVDAPVDVTPPPVDVTPEPVKPPVSQVETSFNDFMQKHKGHPTDKDFNAWMEQLWAQSPDPSEVSSFLDQQEKAGKIKFHSDGTFFVPTGNEMNVDERDFGAVGDPKVNAVQYDNPELHPFFEDAAMRMGHELEMSHPGERYWNEETGADSKWTGVKRTALPQIAQWKDDYHVGWDALGKAVNDIIEDKGRENNANAKRMELILDDMMTNGYRSLDGHMIPPNRDYILAKGGDPDAVRPSGIDEDFMRDEFGEDTDVPTNDFATDTNVGDKQFVDPNKMSGQSADPNKMGEGVGDMGAKTSDFRREDVKMGKGATNTLDTFEQERNVPTEQKVQNQPFGEYTVRHMDEVVRNADLRLEQDYEGEKQYLEEAVNWTDEDVAMSKTIADNLLKEARASGDFSQYNKWMKGVREHQTTSGQTVNAWKLYKKATYEGIMKQASDLLENAAPGTDVDAVMEEVAQFAEEFDRALKAGNESVDHLVNLIKRTARHRRTGTFWRNRITKDTSWALDRIAAYAKQDAAKAAADGTSLGGRPTAASFKVGDVVKANDRGNYGHITAKNDDGTYTVHFKSHSGREANVNFDAETLESTFTRQTKASDIAADPGAAYDFLRNFAAAGIDNIAGDHVKASKVDKALDIRRNSMLSKISTTLRNLVGNGVFDPVDSLAVNVGTLIDSQLAKMTGTRSSAVDKSWFSKEKRKGSLDGLAMAIMEVSLDVDSNGASSKYDAPSNRAFKMNEGTNKLNDVFNRVFSTWDKYMGYALTAPDEFQKGGIQAEYQRGIDKLYEQGKIADDSLQDAGTDMAKYRTFQGESYLSNALIDARKALNGRGEKNTHIGDIAIPFAQVPANLASISADYSPIGLAKGAVEVANVLKAAHNKTLTAAQQAKAVHDLGRGITGTGLIAIFAALAHAGIVRVANPGDEDENKDKAAIERMQGFNGTQLNVDAVKRWASGGSPEYQDGDTLVQIGFLDPINAQMTTGALIAEDWDEMTGTDKIGHALKSSFDGTIQAVLDLPVMNTMRSAQMAYQQSKGETSGEKITDAIKDFGASAATSFIPNILKGVAEAKDPYVRDLYSKETIGGRTLDKLKYAIPGKYGRESLPVKLDSFGQPIKDEDNFRRAMNAMINPGRTAEYHTDETIEGLNALNKATGETSIYPGKKPPKRFAVDGKDVQLTYEQQQSYQRTRGEAEQKNRQAIFGSEQYKGLSGDLQLKVQKKAEEYANSLAKASLGVGYELSDAEKELQQLSPEEFAGRLVDDVLIAERQKEIKANGNPELSLYRAMADLLKNDKIDQDAVLDHASPSFNEAYNEYMKPHGIPVDALLNLHATLSDRPGQYNSDRKENALDALNGMGLSAKDKGYVAQALYQINPDVMIHGDTAPVGWLAGVGADESLVYGNMTDSKQNAYDSWVKGYDVTPSEYAKIYGWFSSQESDKDANGKTTYGKQDKLVDYLDQLYKEEENDKKIRIFMSLYPKSQKRAEEEWLN